MTTQKEVLAFTAIALAMLVVATQPAFAVEWHNAYTPEEMSKFRSFTPEEVAESQANVTQNLTATLLREALEMKLQETNPEVFQEIARQALLAHSPTEPEP